MANPKLTVEIDGDIRKLEAAVNRAEKLVVDFGKGTGGGSSGGRNVFKPATDSANKYENQINDLSNAIDKYRSSNEEIVNSTRRTGDLMTDLATDISRVERELQDTIVISRGYAKEQDRLNRELQDGSITSQEYGKALDRLTRDEKETQVAVKDLRSELRRLKADYKTLNTGAHTVTKTTNATTQSVGRMAKTTRVNAVPAMTSFSQVVQDAPYGIQGVANNIQQLTMQMGYLSRGAGGAGGALKAMVSSLLGPAGILLAVSALTTAFISYGDEILDFIKNTSDAEKAQRRLAEAMASGIGEARTSAIELSALTDEIKTNNGSLLTQTKAYNKLNDVAPELTEIYTLQEIAAGKADTAIKKLTDSILKQAQIEGAKTVITELNEEMFKLESSLGEGTASFWDWLEAAKQTAGLALTPGDYSTFRELLEMRGAATGREEIAELDKQLDKFTQRYRELIGESVTPSQDQDFFNINSPDAREAALAQQKILDDLAEKAKSGEPVRIPIEPILDLSQLQRGFEDAPTMELFQGGTGFKKMIEDDIALMKLAQSQFSEFSNEYRMIGDQIKVAEDRASGFGNSLVESGKVAAEELKKIGADLTTFNQEQQTILEEQAQQHAQKQQMIAGIVSNSFAAMGSELIDAASEGEVAFKDLTSIILKSVGKMLVALLSQALGNAVVAGTQSSLAAGPGAAFAMPGLIGLTTGAVQSSFPAFQDGGIVGGNSMYGDKILARVNSKEAIFNQDQQRSIWGQMNTPAMIGNGEPIEIVGETLIEGDNLRVIYERNNRNRSRQT